MKVRNFLICPDINGSPDLRDNPVDYILFFTGDVDLRPNPNEIRDYKYVSKEELQKMFDDPGASILSFFSGITLYGFLPLALSHVATSYFYSKFFYPLVQANCA